MTLMEAAQLYEQFLSRALAFTQFRKDTCLAEVFVYSFSTEIFFNSAWSKSLFFSFSFFYFGGLKLFH